MLSDETRKSTIDNIVGAISSNRSEKFNDSNVYQISFEHCTFKIIKDDDEKIAPKVEFIEHYFNPESIPSDAYDRTFNEKCLSYRGDETGLLDVFLHGVALDQFNGVFMKETVPIYSNRTTGLDRLQNQHKNRFDALLMYVATEFDVLYRK